MDVLKLKHQFKYTRMSIIKKLELRKATGKDFKAASNRWKVGQPYCVGSDENNHIKGIFVIRGNEDAFVFKMMLDKELIFVPMNEPFLDEFIKLENDDV